MYFTPKVPKAEFYRRLVHLRKTIDDVLEFRISPGNLFPALFSVFSFMWCKCPSDMFKSVSKDTVDRYCEFWSMLSSEERIVNDDGELPF